MTVQISGKNVDLGESLQDHIEFRINETLSKYFDGGFTGHVTLSREGSGFRTDCAIHLDTGINFQSSDDAHDPRASFDLAAEHLGKQLRRYNRKLKDHKHHENV